MAVDITVKLLNSKELQRNLRKNGEQWAKCVQRTISDMRTRGPKIIGENAAEVYNAKPASLNPRNKSSRGSVSASGGLTSLELRYVGSPQGIGTFVNKANLSPKSSRNRNPYKITAEFVKGKTTTIGHWNPPGTEGGRYAGKSPRMYIPGVSRFGPVQRVGSGWNGGNFGPAVPQMVMNRGNDEKSREALSELMATRLEHHLRQFGLV
ncbi:hypothetical protein H6A18_09395 [Collinsella tanakaei]|uniref:hypothetical protein n=1 Tax=Collinsella tanakaei TaxID=626935 RepID=UPI001958AA11|nr:hypothetical protein [Collinsella tanakaei]MBM6756715.1 hypothetical protein [Collinsella tanakaei]